MGDFLTHVLHAERVRERIESRRLLEGISSRPALYRLGAQGPDVLFFHRTFPDNGKNSLQPLGHRMHEMRTGRFLSEGFARLAAHSWGDEWLDLAVYLAGFVCHHCLDRVLHPYVNHADAKWLWSVDGRMVTVTHMEVELALDVLLWERRGSGPAYRTSCAQLADVGKAWPPGVLAFWLEGLADVYGVKVDERTMNEALAHFRRGNRLLYDPKGWKKKLVIWLDNLSGGGIQPPKVPYPVAVSKDLDWLNRKHRTWFNPEKPEEKRDETVDELLGRAADEAAAVINAAYAALMNGREFRHLFPEIRYDNGMPCDPEPVEAPAGDTNEPPAGDTDEPPAGDASEPPVNGGETDAGRVYSEPAVEAGRANSTTVVEPADRTAQQR